MDRYRCTLIEPGQSGRCISSIVSSTMALSSAYLLEQWPITRLYVDSGAGQKYSRLAPSRLASSPVSSPEIPSFLALVALARAARDEGRHSCHMQLVVRLSFFPSPAEERAFSLAENFSG